MFDNLDEGILWKFHPSTLKVSDTATKQMFYEGEFRGQTERFLYVIGRLIKQVFTDIDSIYTADDPERTKSDYLLILQKIYAGNYFDIDTPEDENNLKDFLNSIIYAWKLKGTEGFLRWIIFKLFEWELMFIETAANLVFRLGIYTSLLYTPERLDDAQSILFDPNRFLPVTKTGVVIDVKEDPDYEAKKGVLLALSLDWVYISRYKFINLPGGGEEIITI